MKCVNCEREEAGTVWDSLAFQRRIGVSTLSEWATGYEKAGLCPACRRALAHRYPAMLFPGKDKAIFYPANILRAAGAALCALDFFFGSMGCAFAGVALLLGSLALGYTQRHGDDGENTAIGAGLLLGIVGLVTSVCILLSANARSRVGTTGWIGFGLLGAAILLYWAGWLLLRRFATGAESPRDALLLGKVEKDGKMFVPLGEGLYGSRKEFLAVNSLMSSNEEKVYDTFIATGKWREMVEKPELFRFLSL